MKILVTGGAGFIGVNFVKFVLARHPADEVVVLDALTYAGNPGSLATLQGNSRFEFVKGDICSSVDVAAVLEQHACDAVVNFAAETHVDRSLMDVRPFISANVLGVQTLLDACREHGIDRFVQVSTDEVYGSMGPEGTASETSPIQPNNPYAATKASAEFLVRAAFKSHGLDTIVTRCSNNFGPYQFPEKFIPLVILNAMDDRPTPVYGDGMHVRDWIFVEDHCGAVDLALRKGVAGETYNIGGGHDVPNVEIVRTVITSLAKSEDLIQYVADRPGHDRRYAIDCSKIRERLSWEPEHEFADAIRATVQWYGDNSEWCEGVRSGEYAEYYEKMYGDRLRDGGNDE